MSNSLWPHGLQHARPPCTSSNPGVYSNSCPLSQWCHPTHLILCCPLLFLLSTFPSIRIFSNESVLCIRWPKYWSFSFNISPSNDNSGLISLRIDWFDLLACWGTLKSLLQHHSLKTSVLQHPAFLWSNSHICTWLLEKMIAFTMWTFAGKVMSLLFNMLSRFVIAFLPRSKYIVCACCCCC